MIDGAVDMRADADQFRLQNDDPIPKFGDGIAVEALSRQFGEKIALAIGEQLFRVHEHSVDRAWPDVNNWSCFFATSMMMTMDIPAGMKAIDPATAGGPEVLELVDRPVPTPGAGEVLIRVAAAGVNRPDVLQRRGFYPPPAGAPSVPGLEVAGTIVALGQGVDDVHLNTEVCALLAGGGYAQYAVAPIGQCLPRPAVLSMEEAAALPETVFTVWVNVFERAYAQPGETILIHGGTSGIGTIAVQLADAFGLMSIVTCGSDEKCTAALCIGAHHAINYRTEDFAVQARAFTGGRGVDIILDMVGGDYLPRNIDCLADDGRISVIAVQGGVKGELDMGAVLRRRLTLTGSALRPRPVEFKSMVADELARTVWPLIEEGRLKPVMDRIYPLEEAAAAHRRMEAGDHVGKIVLRVNQ